MDKPSGCTATSSQLQAGVNAYQGWKANVGNACSSAYGGNLHDLARRMHEAMTNAAPQEASAEAASQVDGEAGTVSKAEKATPVSVPHRSGESAPAAAAPFTPSATQPTRRDGHSALRVRDGKMEAFDPHPPSEAALSALKAWQEQIDKLTMVLPPTVDEAFIVGWNKAAQSATVPNEVLSGCAVRSSIQQQRGSELADDEAVAIGSLIALAGALYFALDDSEDRGEEIILTAEHYRALCEAMDKLHELPDDKPGYTMGPAAKARWALRRVLPEPVSSDSTVKP